MSQADADRRRHRGRPVGAPPVDIETFIRTRLRLAAVPGLPTLCLYTAHSASGLSHVARSAAPPYWAYAWAGGLALAHHVAARPDIVHGRRVLDLGAGSGLVAIAAARAGAEAVIAAETDANGATAIALNAAVNDVRVDIATQDFLDLPPPRVDIIAVGDLFYAADLVVRVMAFLRRCRYAGLDVLIGDPGRSALPKPSLRTVAAYEVADFGLASLSDRVIGTVYELVPPRLTDR